jgi:hypothetical protein
LGNVVVAADIRTGRIFKIIAHDGYTGLLLGKISVGMRIGDVKRLLPDLAYDEGSDLFLINGVDGVSVDVAVQEPDPGEVDNMLVSAISVYDAELREYR